MVHFLEAVILGATQGISEFLPISSTAHLIILQRLFNLDQDVYGLSFDMFTNLGTLVATYLFFWGDIKELAGRLRFPSPHKPLEAKEKLPWTILLASVPVGILGLLLQEKIETEFRSLAVIAASLVAVGILMIWVEKKTRQTQATEPSAKQVYGISLSQCLAFVPGVSRSGITVSTGMLMGLDRVKAARYSFLLSLPITTAAVVSQLAKFGRQVAEGSVGSDVLTFYLVGGATSLIVGYLTIRFLLDFYKKYSLSSFAYYRFALAAFLVILMTVWKQ